VCDILPGHEKEDSKKACGDQAVENSDRNYRQKARQSRESG
jgi:hypothetical protein